MKKLLALLLSGTMVLGLLSGCSSEKKPVESAAPSAPAAESAAPAPEGKTYKVGFSNVWVGNTWGVQCVNELEAYLRNNEQISDIEDLIAKGVDMLILQPISAESVAAVVEEAYDAGIVVVDCTSPLSDATDKYNVSVVARDYDFGYVGAKWLCEQLGGEGNIVCLDGMAGLSSAVLRMEGANAAFSEYPGIKVLASEYANWDYATAKPVMENLMAAYDNIDGVWSSGGDMTRAAIEVWADSGRDWIPMMGEDCNGFLKLWSQYKDDGLSCIATSLPTWLFAYGAELGLEVLNGTYTGEKDIIVEIPTITNEQVGDYVREDLSDSFWCGTRMSEEDIQALYGNGNDGSQGLSGQGVTGDH